MEPDVKLTKLASCAGCGAKGSITRAISAAEPLTPIAAYILSPLALTIAFQLACSRAANSKMQNTVMVIADRFNSEGHRNVTRARAACQRGVKANKTGDASPAVHRTPGENQAFHKRARPAPGHGC